MAKRPSPTLANAVAPGVRVERIEPLQRRVERNRIRFVVFMLLFTTAVALSLFVVFLAVILVIGILVLGATTEGAPLVDGRGALTPGVLMLIALAASLAAAWTWSLVRLSRSEITLLRRLGAQMPKAGTLLSTKSALRDMTIASGLPATPQFYVIDSPGVNAFALGRTPERIRVGVTRGMLERIPIDEQRAVFANLVARVLSGDTRWATAVSALMGPIWAMREYDLRYEPREPTEDERLGGKPRRPAEDSRAAMFLLYGLAVIVTELLSWYHREAAWSASEKADAEGMLFLKDPRSMLRAIEHVLERNNHVLTAGDAYSQLFFCWAGYGFAPEDDPEMRRVARLRETLGAEGAAYVPRPNVPGWPTAPAPPRIELLEQFTEEAGTPDV